MSLALYPLQLSPAAVGQGYVMGAQPLTPVGGVAPFTWSVSAGSLPVGLDLNTAAGGTGKTSAVIEGTPRVADQYTYPPQTQIPSLVNPSTFEITVTDSSSPPQSVTMQYTMPVGVFSERQAISIYEMLDAFHVFAPIDPIVLLIAPEAVGGLFFILRVSAFSWKIRLKKMRSTIRSRK